MEVLIDLKELSTELADSIWCLVVLSTDLADSIWCLGSTETCSFFDVFGLIFSDYGSVFGSCCWLIPIMTS